MRAALRNRFVVVFLGLAVIVALWNVYVAQHADGIVAGRVVDAAGRPAAGATVTLFERDFVSEQEHGHALTDADGRFRFTNNRSHLVQLEAVSGAARSPRVTLRLWFRSQDAVLDTPLRLAGPG